MKKDPQITSLELAQPVEQANESLEVILSQNDMGKNLQTISSIENKRQELKYIETAMFKLSADDYQKLEVLDTNDQNDLKQAAVIMGISEEEAPHIGDLVRAQSELIELYDNLDNQWKAELPGAKISEITTEELHRPNENIRTVYYGADWCGPCKAIRTDLLKLSKFYEPGELYFSDDKALREDQGIKTVPYLVTYFPDGRKVTSECGNTTQELWDRMNLLVGLGKNIESSGSLTCTETECRVVPS